MIYGALYPFRIIETKIVCDGEEKPSKLRTPMELAAYCRGKCAQETQEHFFAAYVDGRNIIIGVKLVSLGTQTASLVHPTHIFGDALRLDAVGVFIVHNHPSGDPTPSTEDREVTRRMVEIGKILGIKVIDHLVLGRTEYYSFSEEGGLE